jgi:ABC-type transport system involved in cytochrome bd biosynthesis fused ATPase/permease subunit
MSLPSKKIITPTIIAFIVSLYYILLTVSFIFFNIPLLVIIIMSIFSIIITILLFYVLMQRIQEIKKGEEDDLSKY